MYLKECQFKHNTVKLIMFKKGKNGPNVKTRGGLGC